MPEAPKPDHVVVPLTKGKVALLSPEDADLARFFWQAKRDKKTFYAARTVAGADGRRREQKLHRAVAARMGVDIVGTQIDHANGDGLDNRRENIRRATPQQNASNRGRFRNNSSGYKGVSFCKRLQKWQAYIRVRRLQKHLGFFAELLEAALAYDRAARKHFGAFAQTNYPAFAAGEGEAANTNVKEPPQ